MSFCRPDVPGSHRPIATWGNGSRGQRVPINKGSANDLHMRAARPAAARNRMRSVPPYWLEGGAANTLNTYLEG